MRRIGELDALRGLAALAIMVYHLKPQAMPLGWTPVDLFMVLSGYLITTIILRNGGASNFLLAFYARRGLRIWPIYYLTLLALVAVNFVISKPFPMDGLPYYLTFTQNIQRYWSDSVPAFNWYFLHTWSLALEEQFYLLWPALLCLAGRRRLVPLALALVAMSVLARAGGADWWILLGRCDGFALGGLLAALLFDSARVERHRRALLRGFGAACLGGAIVVAFILPRLAGVDFGDAMSAGPSLVVFALNLFHFGVVGLVLLHAGRPMLAPLRARPLVGLGQISYGLYLFHPMVFISLTMLGRRLGGGDPLWLEPVKLAATVGVAVLSWHLVERPILAWKDRFGYHAATARPVAVAPGRLATAEA